MAVWPLPPEELELEELELEELELEELELEELELEELELDELELEELELVELELEELDDAPPDELEVVGAGVEPPHAAKANANKAMLARPPAINVVLLLIIGFSNQYFYSNTTDA